jgi:signal peptidase
MKRKAAFLILTLLSIGSLAPSALIPITATSPNSHSMSPSIGQDDVVIVTSSDEYSKGDVILFDSEKSRQPVLHRIVDVKNENGNRVYITQGDRNPEIDQSDFNEFDPVRNDDIYGSVFGFGQPSITSPHDGVKQEHSNSLFKIPFIGIFIGNTVLLLSMWISLGLIKLSSKFSKSKLYGGHRLGNGPPSGRVEGGDWKMVFMVFLLVLSIGIPAFSVYMGIQKNVLIQSVDKQVVENSNSTEGMTAVGHSTTENITVESEGQKWMQFVVVVDSNELELVDYQSRTFDTKTKITVRNKPRDEVGVSSGTVKMYPIPGLIPHSLLQRMSDISPYLPGFIVGVLLSVTTYLLMIFNEETERYDDREDMINHHNRNK